jgi:hypothetical protein
MCRFAVGGLGGAVGGEVLGCFGFMSSVTVNQMSMGSWKGEENHTGVWAFFSMWSTTCRTRNECASHFFRRDSIFVLFSRGHVEVRIS